MANSSKREQGRLRDLLAKEESRRDFIKLAIETGLFMGVAGSSVARAGLFGDVPRELEKGESIYKLKGEVSVDSQRADKSTVVTASSTIRTGSNSLVVFRVGSDAHILRENSEMQLSGENYVEEGLRLVTGKLLSVFGARTQGQTHTMKTTTATIGIRGTGVYAESESDHSYVCTCYGVVDIYSDEDKRSKERVVSQHHDAPRYIMSDGKEGGLIQAAPMKNHTDEELMLVETIVGRTAPFSGIGSYSKPRKSY